MHAHKGDKDKLMFNLLVPEFLEGMADVMTSGAKKYAPDNWQGLDPDRILAALYRHLVAYHRGEKVDKESGLNHNLHIACNAMFLYWSDEVKNKGKCSEVGIPHNLIEILKCTKCGIEIKK